LRKAKNRGRFLPKKQRGERIVSFVWKKGEIPSFPTRRITTAFGLDHFRQNRHNSIMGRVFCVANQKGGVGKTTTAVSLADGFAKSSAKTLLIDFDPQCNATSGLGLEPIQDNNREPGTVSPGKLTDGNSFLFSDAIVSARTPNLDVLPGNRNTADMEVLLRTQPDEAARIHAQIQQLVGQYEYVLFDCPPSLGHLTQLALFSSTEIFIPIQCEFFAMEGLTQMIAVIKTIMEQKPEQLEFGGILLTMYDASLELTHEVEREVRDFFGEIVFKTVIPRDATISEAPSHGRAIIDYAPRSRGARAYVELCMEILDHRGKNPGEYLR
jgi:chromosome partitioning protein